MTTKKKKGGDYSRKVITAMLTFTVMFVVAVLIVFWHTGNEPSALVASVFGMITGELAFLAGIKKKKVESDYYDDDERII